MEDRTKETTENQTETNRFQIRVDDTRKKKDTSQQFALSERLKIDKVDLALLDTKGFLGKYSAVEPNDLSVRIMGGKLGEGTIQGTVIEIQLPPQDQAIAEMRTMLESILEDIPGEKRDAKCKEIILASSASTVLHEGIHGLLDSKPSSHFAHDFEETSGIQNKNGEIATLLDEAIAYAIQGIYAPEVDPLGKLTPSSKETDHNEVGLRKDLGEKLRPKVEEYLEEKKTIDSEFFSFAGLAMRDLEDKPQARNNAEKTKVKRFVLPEDPQIRERLDQTRNGFKRLKESCPEAIAMTIYRSMVKGAAREESDIDSFVFFEEEATRRQLINEDWTWAKKEKESSDRNPSELDLAAIHHYKPIIKKVMEEVGLSGKQLQDMRVRVISNKIISEELIRAAENDAKVVKWERKTDEIGKLPVEEWIKLERPKHPDFYSLDWKISTIFHLAIGRSLTPYREKVLAILASQGEVGERVWKQIIGSVANMEKSMRGSNYPNLYPQTIEAARKYFSLN